MFDLWLAIYLIIMIIFNAIDYEGHRWGGLNTNTYYYRFIKHRSCRPEQDYHHCLLQVSLVIMPNGQTNNNWSNKILDDECDHAHHNHSQLGDETTFTFKVVVKIIASSNILLKCHFFIEFLHVRYQVCQCRHRKF